MYKSHRDIAAEKPDFKIASKALAKEFSEDIKKATDRYIDKTIQTYGEVTDIESGNFTLDGLIVCYTDSVTIKEVTINNNVYAKGRSIGYDELLGLVKLDQVRIIHP
jgi:hypothetical protein